MSVSSSTIRIVGGVAKVSGILLILVKGSTSSRDRCRRYCSAGANIVARSYPPPAQPAYKIYEALFTNYALPDYTTCGPAVGRRCLARSHFRASHNGGFGVLEQEKGLGMDE